MCGIRSRRSSSTSRKCSRRDERGLGAEPLSTAFVATVVPCTTSLDAAVSRRSPSSPETASTTARS